MDDLHIKCPTMNLKDNVNLISLMNSSSFRFQYVIKRKTEGEN
jgi:hypothetical protein